MPHPDDNEIEDMDPSTVSAQDDAQPAAVEQAAADAGQAASSAANGEDADTLSVVRDVVKEARGDQASPAEGDEDGSATGASATRKELDDENFTDVPFHKHQRFQQLLRAKKAAEVDAVRYQNVERFLSEEGLTGEEAADTLRIVALARRDPAAAWQAVRPWVQNLLIAAGEVLPDDLAQRVQRGELTPDAAVEVSRSRAAVQAGERQRQFTEHQTQRREHQTVMTSITTAVNAWEADRQLKDPNFAAKMAPLQREIVWMHTTEGRPTTAEQARDQLDRAYKAVNASFRAPAAQPSRPAIRPVTGGQAKGNVAPSQMSTLDIVRANRRGAR